MWWNRKEPELPQPNTAPAKSDLEQRVERLERNMRMFEGDREDWLNKFKTLTARISRQLERAEAREAPQNAPEPTIPEPIGVTPPKDRWQRLKELQDARRRA